MPKKIFISNLLAKQAEKKGNWFLSYSGLRNSSGMRHICGRSRCLFHGDSGTSRITADQVCPATPANHCLLSNNPIYQCIVNP